MHKSTPLNGSVIAALATPLLAVAISMGFAQRAAAQFTTLYLADFNSPTYTDGVLLTPTGAGDTTTVGQGGWINTSGNTNLIAVSNSATNGLVSLTTSGQDVRHLFDSAQTVTSGSVWFDADVTVSAAQATGDYAMLLSDGGTTNFYARTYFKSSGAGFVMALGTSSGVAVTYGSLLSFGTTYHVLARYDFVSGLANDTGALFINPTTMDGSGDTAYVAATTTGTDATTIAAEALRQGTAGSAATLTVDNFRAFTIVPEPSSLGSLLVGATVLLGRRRKR